MNDNTLSKRMHLGREAAPWVIAEVEKLEQLVEDISYTAKNRKKKMHLYRDALQDVGKWSQEVQDELEKVGVAHAISMWRGCVAVANAALEQGGDAVKGRDPVYPIGVLEEERMNEKMVDVEVDFTDEEFLRIAKLAHEEDITFNQYVRNAIEAAMAAELTKRSDALDELAELDADFIGNEGEGDE